MADDMNNMGGGNPNVRDNEPRKSGSSMGWIIGLIIILAIILLLIFGLPGATTDTDDGDLNTDLPNEIDVNLDTPEVETE